MLREATYAVLTINAFLYVPFWTLKDTENCHTMKKLATIKTILA